MGLRLRGDAWYLRRNVGGKRQEIALGIYGARNRAKAEKAATTALDELNKARIASSVMKRFGIETPAARVDGEVTFAGWWEDYKRTYAPGKTAGTQARDEGTIAHWLPIFGDAKLVDIKQMHCVAGMNLRRKAKVANPHRKNPTIISESTVQRERRFLQAVFERAVENGIIERNPWKGIKGVADRTRHDRVLSEADEPKLIAALESERLDATGRTVRMHPRYVRFVQFMLETGLRIDELLNEHFIDKGDRIEVRGKFSKQRSVPLTKRAHRILDEQWADPDRPAKERRPWWQIEQRFRDVMATACERAGIRHLSPHDLRHTFGHRYLSKGGDIYVLSKILGHASVSVTEKHYAYLRREDVTARMLAVMDPQQAVSPNREARPRSVGRKNRSSSGLTGSVSAP